MEPPMFKSILHPYFRYWNHDLGLDGPAGVELKLIAADNDEVPLVG